MKSPVNQCTEHKAARSRYQRHAEAVGVPLHSILVPYKSSDVRGNVAAADGGRGRLLPE